MRRFMVWHHASVAVLAAALVTGCGTFGKEIDETRAKLIESAGIEKVRIRSVLTCESKYGVSRVASICTPPVKSRPMLSPWVIKDHVVTTVMMAVTMNPTHRTFINGKGSISFAGALLGFGLSHHMRFLPADCHWPRPVRPGPELRLRYQLGVQSAIGKVGGPEGNHDTLRHSDRRQV